MKKKKDKKGFNKKEVENSQEEDQNKESELEKEIEETESQEVNKILEKTSEETIDDNEFHEFIKPSIESFTPVLERIEIPQQESLEQNVDSAPITQIKDEEQIKYSATSNEPNYSTTEKIKYQTNIEPLILKPTEISEDLPRQELLEPLTRLEINPQNNLRPKMVNIEFIEEKTRLPFEKDDKKYKEFRL